jgi:uncharacterized membrane protein HdeD (DUF308 family)
MSAESEAGSASGDGEPQPKSPTEARGGRTVGQLFRRSWWAIGLRGVLGIVLGVAMLSYPAMTLAVFIAMIGFYLFLDGMFTLVATFHAAEQERSWGPYLVEGLVSVGLGILALARPSAALLLIILMLALRALVVGLVEVGTGLAIRRETGRAPWLLSLGGIASLLFAALLIARPGIAALALVWAIGAYAIVFGVLLTGDAFRLHETSERLATHTT